MLVMKTTVYLFFFGLLSCGVGVHSQLCAVDKSKFSWFHANDMYYVQYSDGGYLADAQCVCRSLPGTRLAIFDQSDGDLGDLGNYSEVTAYLSQHYLFEEFWVDASRNTSDGNFTWANGCPLPVNTPAWYSNEPNFGEPFVRIKFSQTDHKWLYAGRGDSRHKPLCQSSQPPPNYLPTPPVLEWVSLGEPGFKFGFSNERLALDDARLACEQQAGKVYLATLDTLYNEVADYILNNHPDKTYWLDAVSTHYAFPFAWPTGANIISSYVASSNGVVMVNEDNTMKLSQSSAVLPFYFICRGHPDLDRTSSSGPLSGEWVMLGSPGRNLSFSDKWADFMGAREACAAQAGNVRLAVLDTVMPEVINWIFNNHPSRQYWVDGTQPEYDSIFLWGDGKTMEAEPWQPGEPDSNDLVARLKYSYGLDNITLAGTGSYGSNKYFVCEQIPDITLEWRLLGSPQKLFGFSRTPSWGLEWARDACIRQPGDVKLASLDTHFDDVKQVISDDYSDDDFWVDATYSAATGGFRWSNGEAVENVGWLAGEQNRTAPQARMTSGNGVVGLATTADPYKGFNFICEGNPAIAVASLEFPAPSCMVNSSVTTSSAPVTQTTYETSTANTAAPSLACNLTTLKVVNISTEVVLDLVQQIKVELLLDTNNLTSSIRKRTSAKDDRPSAQTAGYLAISMLVVVFSLLLLSDISTVISAIVRKVTSKDDENEEEYKASKQASREGER